MTYFIAMIISKTNIRQISANLFLYTFIVFLLLQFNHSHFIDVKTNQNSAISAEEKDSLNDPFLDSSLNCTLISFNNSLSFQSIVDLNFGILNLTSNLLDTFQLSYSSIHFNSNQLRAPPINLV